MKKVLTFSNNGLPITQFVQNQPFHTKIDFSDFSYGLGVRVGDSTIRSDFVLALGEKPGAHTVDVSGHPEIFNTNFIFSRFRKELPNLKTLIIKNIPNNFGNRELIKHISPEQIFKYIENGINIVSEQWLIEELKEIVKNLIMNDDKIEKYSALRMVENYFTTIPICKKEIHLLNNEIEAMRLLRDYHTGRGVFSNPAIQESRFFIDRPLIRWPNPDEDEGTARALFNLYVTITATNLWSVVKKGPGDGGYMFSSQKELDRVYFHPLVLLDGHMGHTLGCCMRVMEYIASNGFPIQEQYTKSEQDCYLLDLDVKIKEKVVDLSLIEDQSCSYQSPDNRIKNKGFVT